MFAFLKGIQDQKLGLANRQNPYKGAGEYVAWCNWECGWNCGQAIANGESIVLDTHYISRFRNRWTIYANGRYMFDTVEPEMIEEIIKELRI